MVAENSVTDIINIKEKKHPLKQYFYTFSSYMMVYHYLFLCTMFCGATEGSRKQLPTEGWYMTPYPSFLNISRMLTTRFLPSLDKYEGGEAPAAQTWEVSV